MNHEIKPSLKKIMQKLLKKDRELYNEILNKIGEITKSGDIEHYKNLKYGLKELKRVHIGSFVLVFRFEKDRNMVSFEDLQHHDNIYRR